MSKMPEDILGLSLQPGDSHYRAYVGPPGDYDLVSAMTFGLLTACGLRQGHTLLDVGCGSLRLGRLLIPYLNPGNYIGLEPNKWLVDDGLRYEVGASLAEVRAPAFIYDTSLDSLPSETLFDYVVAQSIFSHTAPDLLGRWIADIAASLSQNGILLATVIRGSTDFGGEGWIYPECVEYRLETVAAMAAREGLQFQVLDWFHPRQQWCAMYRPEFDVAILNGGKPSWNNYGAISQR
jgi:cyclopropane fatty-acyl-phospholipid synthase-like methyltransferase